MVSSVAILAQPAPPSPTSPQDGAEETIIRAKHFKHWQRLTIIVCAMIFVTYCAYSHQTHVRVEASSDLEQVVGSQIFTFLRALKVSHKLLALV